MTQSSPGNPFKPPRNPGRQKWPWFWKVGLVVGLVLVLALGGRAAVRGVAQASSNRGGDSQGVVFGVSKPGGYTRVLKLDLSGEVVGWDGGVVIVRIWVTAENDSNTMTFYTQDISPRLSYPTDFRTGQATGKTGNPGVALVPGASNSWWVEFQLQPVEGEYRVWFGLNSSVDQASIGVTVSEI